MLGSVRDDLGDVLLEIDSRRARALLLVAAVSLSVGSLVASVGVSTTAAAQIGADIAAGMLNEVTLTRTPGGTFETPQGELFDPGAEARAAALPMVTAAGLRIDVEHVVASPRRFLGDDPVTGVQVFGATSGYLHAVSLSAPTAGWMFDRGSSADVALVGASAARALGIGGSPARGDYQIRVAGRVLTVVGTLDAKGDRRLDSTIMVPYDAAVTWLGGDEAARLVVRTEVGAGSSVAAVLREAVVPSAPATVTASRVVDPLELRRGVQEQLSRLVGAVGALLLFVTALLIANSMIVSVVARTAEIGLRRALGASRADVVRTFLYEGALVGALGGLGGAAIGTWAVVAVAHMNSWTAVLDSRIPVAAVAIGVVVGLMSAGYPAARAASIRPAVAVRVE
ncbi:ABC transporter permease [Cellulomonas sp. APG4]|uniref:ABC transporter permease n=1 Tax=Cellulomonas sp. APG4 TaxID=1538656 RepID=UPI001ED92FF9|nr:FtsX-like permease family protein [Cellulomonas sp. APG4]